MQFANRQRDVPALARIFGRVCREHDIKHRPTKAKHPWSNGPPLGEFQLSPAGQAGRTKNRTIKDATIRRCRYDDHDRLRDHLSDVLAACNVSRRLETLGGLAPCELICKAWTSETARARRDPIHQMPVLNT
ncbi:MAG: hypothetical protein AAF676_02760 [Pseudomonadota bacterium]